MKRTLDPDPPKAPRRLAHFVLRVQSLERSLAWYQEVVGMEVVQRGDKLAFLTFDHEHHRLALMETPIPAGQPGAPGLDHTAFAVDSLGQLLATYRRLEKLGHRPYLPINHGPTTSLYYHDPDGNGVEFFVDNFESTAELKGWMETEAFKANPIGIRFDPEALIARYEAGEALEDLLRRPTSAG